MSPCNPPSLLCLVALATLLGAPPARSQELSAADVRQVVSQAAAGAAGQGLQAWVAVTDSQGNVLGLFRMSGAPETSLIPGTPGRGLGALLPSAGLAAISKAGTGAFLSSRGHAFTTRTGSFIVQEHFPPKVEETPGGPLFGVQLSSLPCSDVQRPALPVGLSGDPGGLPLYRGGRVVGGVAVEAGPYGIDLDPATLEDADDATAEERAALAGQRGFEPPSLIVAERILADGIRLPYVNVTAGSPAPVLPPGSWVVDPRAAPPGRRVPATLAGVPGNVDPLLPTRAGSALSAAEVSSILGRAAQQAVRTRAAIRQPLGSPAQVSIAVVDVDGRVLGFFQNEDAPTFGVDVSVQKARTAAFFSTAGAGAALRQAGFGIYTGPVALDGRTALSTRTVGFLAQPFFPPGISRTDPGPFSPPRAEWSVFATGLQTDLVSDVVKLLVAQGPSVSLQTFLAANGNLPLACTAVPGLPNGITLFPGGIPLYRDGRLVGAIGVSGDGVDQDDLIAAAGAAGFDAPAEQRGDAVELRGVRLPYLKFPRHPEL